MREVGGVHERVLLELNAAVVLLHRVLVERVERRSTHHSERAASRVTIYARADRHRIERYLHRARLARDVRAHRNTGLGRVSADRAVDVLRVPSDDLVQVLYLRLHKQRNEHPVYPTSDVNLGVYGWKPLLEEHRPFRARPRGCGLTLRIVGYPRPYLHRSETPRILVVFEDLFDFGDVHYAEHYMVRELGCRNEHRELGGERCKRQARREQRVRTNHRFHHRRYSLLLIDVLRIQHVPEPPYSSYSHERRCDRPDQAL